jgi:hypothetical protein
VLSVFSACTKTHAVSGIHSAILLLSVLSSTTHETHVISTEGGVFAAAVERSPHFAVAVAPAFAVVCSSPPSPKRTSSRPKAALLPPQWRDPRISLLPLLLHLPLPVFRSNQPKQSSFRPKAALLPEKPASLPTPSPRAHTAYLFLLLSVL